MPSLKDLKNRIKSVKSTQKITKAMKMVSAAKLRRAKERAEAARPYAEKMAAILASVGSGQTGSHPLIKGTGKSNVHLLVVMTSDRGLCGAFNSSITRATKRKVAELKREGKQVKLLCVGKKSYDLLKNEFGTIIIGRISELGKKRVVYSEAEQVAREAMKAFNAGEVDVVHLVFNHFKSAISQIVTFQQIIPLPAPDVSQPVMDNYEFEPDEESILADLLPRNVAVQIYGALLENAASEQGARMTAMDNATRNAGEMIGKLTLRYNRTRQATITKELIEIISGAEAL
jgi:F-type H+-transporting ATPase subunit gamma